MKIYYFSKEDMVSFGNYLLSEERKKMIMEHPELNEEQKQNSLNSVSDADVKNWFEKQPVELGELGE